MFRSYPLQFSETPSHWSADDPSGIINTLDEGTLCWFNGDRFGLSHAFVLLESIPTNIPAMKPFQVAHLSVCYDEENDVFLTSSKRPPLDRKACDCYFGTGYSACSCVSKATTRLGIVKWFRENQGYTLEKPTTIRHTSIAPMFSHLDFDTRDRCKKIFDPEYSDFNRLSLR